MAMSVSVSPMEQYEVPCSGSKIDTVVTSDAAVISSWILFVMQTYYSQEKEALVVGLDIEWRPNLQPGSDNPVATLQLCIGVHCLIIQMLHHAAPNGGLPRNLFSFLADPHHVFVGVGVGEDAKKLLNDCKLVVKRMVDLRDLTATRFMNPGLKKLGLKKLANLVLRFEMEKPLNVTLSDWDCEKLSSEQVRYACIDAFVSSEIGRKLGAQRYSSVMPMPPPPPLLLAPYSYRACYVATTFPVPVRVCVPAVPLLISSTLMPCM